MNRKICLFMLTGLILPMCLWAQHPAQQEAVDTSFTDYDMLFNDLEKFLDSITAPRSFTMVNMGLAENYFDYDSHSSALLKTMKRVTLTPTVAYFGKSGWGISCSGSMMCDTGRVNPFQISATASYDYVKSNRFITGIAYGRFFTKKNLAFYTSPLNNSLYAYFTYRHFWIKPSVALSYGWGSRTTYSEREDLITSLMLAKNGYARIDKQESITDFNIIGSIRHDFYWIHLFSGKDFLRLTPQFVYVAGTQKFGFNQSTNNNTNTIQKLASDYLYHDNNVYLETKTAFQSLVFSSRLKAEYTVGRFYVQPEFLVDYYMPAATNNISTGFILSTGVIF